MSDWYSNHFGIDGTDDAAAAHPNIKVPVGIGHAKMYVKSASITVPATVAAADVLRMFTLRSSDRLWALYHNTDGAADASNSAEVGIYAVNANHTGAVLDVDLFGAAHDLSTAALDVLTEIMTSGAAGGEDRLKTMWEIFFLGAGTDEVDPEVKYELCTTLNGDDTAAFVYTLTAIYTASN